MGILKFKNFITFVIPNPNLVHIPNFKSLPLAVLEFQFLLTSSLLTPKIKGEGMLGWLWKYKFWITHLKSWLHSKFQVSTTCRSQISNFADVIRPLRLRGGRCWGLLEMCLKCASNWVTFESTAPNDPFWVSFSDFWKILPNCCLISSQILAEEMAVQLLAVFKGRGELSKFFLYLSSPSKVIPTWQISCL